MTNGYDFVEKTEKIVLGGGCFWCLEAVYSGIKGVELVRPGYAGGALEDPDYEQVSSGFSGHAEVVEVIFDPEIISLREIVHIFFFAHDPTTKNRQGSDVGSQYRSIIFYSNDQQRSLIEEEIERLTELHVFAQPIVTEVEALHKFYPAESFHERYFEKNPGAAYCQLVIAPKLAKLKAKLGQYYA